ncbi:MAG TPA: GNAT family N-acetyltransferase [Burkholderiales bacterium]|nr:GNAT family N-acetyltransferase [Burkholderiales bacterium]
MHAAPDARLARSRLRATGGALVRLRDGRVVAIRPARPADAQAVQAFVRGLSPLARRRRFFGAVSELSPDQLDRLTRIRDPRDASLVAIAADAGEPCIVAMAQYATLDSPEAEVAVVVADAWQRQGLGARLLEMLLERAAAAGVQLMNGHVLAENGPMLSLATRLGFAFADDRDPGLVRLERSVPPPRRAVWFAEQLRRLVARRPAAIAAPAFAAEAR